MQNELPTVSSTSSTIYPLASPLSLSHEISIHASRPWLWKKLIDVSNWSEWDHEVAESHLNTDFSIGASGYLIDLSNHRVTFEITDIQYEKTYSNVYFLPMGTKLHFTHNIIGNTEPYRVKFQALFQEFYAAYHHNKFRSEIQTTMQRALDNLSALAIKN